MVAFLTRHQLPSQWWARLLTIGVLIAGLLLVLALVRAGLVGHALLAWQATEFVYLAVVFTFGRYAAAPQTPDRG